MSLGRLTRPSVVDIRSRLIITVIMGNSVTVFLGGSKDVCERGNEVNDVS
jgi:hypothetical protein